MGSLINRFMSFFRDRRIEDRPVCVDRRSRRIKLKEADQRLHDAMERLDMTIKMRREDFMKLEAKHPHAANEENHKLKVMR